jgi:anti-sigma factor RsiW
MSNHIPPLLLAKFVAGDLEEPAAVALAKHLDACPQCATAAAAADPLTGAFASTRDPVVPKELVDQIQAAAQTDEIHNERNADSAASIAVFLLAAAFLLAVIVSPVGVVNGTTSAMVSVVGHSDSLIGREGSLAVGALVSLGIVWAAIRFRKHTQK